MCMEYGLTLYEPKSPFNNCIDHIFFFLYRVCYKCVFILFSRDFDFVFGFHIHLW